MNNRSKVTLLKFTLPRRPKINCIGEHCTGEVSDLPFGIKFLIRPRVWSYQLVDGLSGCFRGVLEIQRVDTRVEVLTQ